MNATQNIPVTDTRHPRSYEINRQIASQARSEFLAEGLSYICLSIRFALVKSISAMGSGSP